MIILALALASPGTWAEIRAPMVSAIATIPELDCVIEPSDIVDVGSAVPGIVESVLADRGDLVKNKAVVATLESSVEQATLELAQVRAELDTAIELRREGATYGYRTLKRNQELLQKSVISAQDIDQIKSETRIAQLQVRQEQENKRIAQLERSRAWAVLEQRTLRSPVNGVVMDRFKSVGEYVEDEPVLRIAQLDPLNVEVVVPVDYLGRIEPGMQAEVTAVVPGINTQRATVQRVDRVADAASGTYGVRLTIPNPDYGIPAGLRCRLAFSPTKHLVEISNAVSHPQKTATPGKDEVEGDPEPEERMSGPEQPDPGNSIRDPGPLAAESVEAVSEPITTATGQPEGCYTLGPVADEPLAHRLAEKMDEWVGELAVRKQSVFVESEFIVFTQRQVNRQAARELVGRLQQADISDFYHFKRGPNRDRVSLGLYKTRGFAIKRQRQLATAGFDTEIQERKQFTTRYWLDFSLPAGATLPNQIERIGRASIPSIISEPAPCSEQLVQR